MPLMFLAFCLQIGIPGIIVSLKIMLHRQPIPDGWFDKSRAGMQYLFVVTAIFLTVINIMELGRGGIFLLFEKPQHAVEITAEIKGRVKNEWPFGGKYGEEDSFYGAGVILEGKKYWLTTYKDLKIGDTIRAEVLPKSRFILKWEQVEDASP